MKEKEEEIKKSSVANKPKPLKKLKPVPQNNQKKAPEPEKKSKRIVIGDLPDYDSMEEDKPEVIPETPAEEVKEVEKPQPEKIKKSEKPEKKNFFERVKDLMYVSAEDDEEEQTEDEKSEEEEKTEIIPDFEEEEENISFTVEEVTENIPDTLDIVSEVLEDSEKESPETEEIPEEKKEPETKPQQKNNNNNNNRNKKKKNRNKNKNKNKNNSNNNNNNNKSSKPEEKKQEESKKPEEEIKEPEKLPEQEEIIEEVTEEVNEEIKEETPEKSEEVKTPEKSDGTAFLIKNGKYGIPVLLCIVLAIIGVIAIVNTLISGGSSSNDKYKKAVYPAVITDISPFDDISELTDNQILSSAIWSVIIDDEKLSQYPQRIDNMAIIPAEDIENVAREIFGDDMRELTHSTITTADSKFYYNDEANSYSVDIKPYTFTYSPEVKSVSKKKGKYIVEVDYIAEHPEWMEEGVSKSAEFTLSKNDSDGYTIDSMREIISE